MENRARRFREPFFVDCAGMPGNFRGMGFDSLSATFGNSRFLEGAAYGLGFSTSQ